MDKLIEIFDDYGVMVASENDLSVLNNGDEGNLDSKIWTYSNFKQSNNNFHFIKINKEIDQISIFNIKLSELNNFKKAILDESNRVKNALGFVLKFKEQLFSDKIYDVSISLSIPKFEIFNESIDKDLQKTIEQDIQDMSYDVGDLGFRTKTFWNEGNHNRYVYRSNYVWIGGLNRDFDNEEIKEFIIHVKVYLELKGFEVDIRNWFSDTQAVFIHFYEKE